MKPRSQAAWDAVRRGHRRVTTIGLWTPEGFVGNLPVMDGSLTVSLSSASGWRSGSLKVPGYEWWPYLRASACSWVDVSTSIDGEPFHLGEWPVIRAVPSHPAGFIDVTLGDWAFRRIRWPAESGFTMTAADRTLAQTVALYAAAGWPVTVTRDDTNGAHPATDARVQPGGNVWAALTEAANSVGAVVGMVSRTTAEVRIIDPNVPYMEDVRGTVISHRPGEFADEAVNRVVVHVQGEGTDADTYTGTATLNGGPYGYDTVFGPAPLVEVMRVPQPSQALADAEARRIADRRFGVVRALELVEVIDQPWLEAGDIIAVTPVVGIGAEPGPEPFLVDTITHPVTPAGSMRIVTRQGRVA